MDGKSLDITADRLDLLKGIFPEVFTEGQIDFAKLKLALGDNIVMQDQYYGLNWAGKYEAFKEIQKQTTATLIPDRENSIEFDNAQNIFIEGENLEALRVLQKSYYGKVKMIYIDPPYNTGNDSFVYPDDYSERLDEFRKRSGIVNDEGFLNKQDLWKKNTRENGQFHSVWLSMMYPRLYLARNLMQDDGFIFVSIDENEVANLRLLMNDVFGEENYRNTIIIKRGAKNVQMQFETIDKLGIGYEYVLFYTKNSKLRFPRMEKKLDELKGGSWNNHWRGTDRPTMRYEIFGITPSTGQWRWGKERSLKAIDNYKLLLQELNKTNDSISQEEIDNWYQIKGEDIDLLRLSKNNKPEHYIPPTESQLLNDVWFDFAPNSTSILKSLYNVKTFDNPKPLDLIKRCLDFTNENDIILDFFAGSGSTGHAVLEYNNEFGGNRKFILIQMPEPCEPGSELDKLKFKNIANFTIDRIKKVINRIKVENSLYNSSTETLNVKSFKISQSNFKIWQNNIAGAEEIIKQLEVFKHPTINDSIDLLFHELLLKSGYYLSVKFIVEDDIYNVNDSESLFILKSINSNTVNYILSKKPKEIFCLDSLFNSDKDKTNFCLQLKENKISINII